jgi:hydroxymethylglutaryl-CoA lyase
MANESVRIFEVAPRDGLQNEPKRVSLQDKVKFIQGLRKAGLKEIEIGSFVHPDRVPQMADTDEVCKRTFRTFRSKSHSFSAWCLVPNETGLHRAIHAGVTHIAVFTASTESFTQKNIGTSIAESLSMYRNVIQEGRRLLGSKLKVRGYVSTSFGCPFEGRVAPRKALKVIENLAQIGVDQISVGDTIGVATPKDVDQLIKPALRMLGQKKIAVHFHDTRGTALANALRSLDLGIRNIDSSAGGLGGCPFAPGASGNLATEDLLYMLNGMGIQSGVNLDELCRASLDLAHRINRPLTSRYLQTWASRSCTTSLKTA